MGIHYVATGEIDLSHGEDFWPLLERAAQVLKPRLRTLVTGRFEGGFVVRSPVGTGEAETVYDAMILAEDSRVPPDNVELLVREVAHTGPMGRRVSVHAENLQAPPESITRTRQIVIRVSSPEDGNDIKELGDLLLEEITVARDKDTEAEQAEVREMYERLARMRARPPVAMDDDGVIRISDNITIGPSEAPKSPNRVRRVGSAVTRVLNHNWTITLVGGLIVTVVGTVIAVLLVGS